MESMVVIAIVGILATIGFNNWEKFSVRARNAEAKTTLSRIYSSEKTFYFEWLGYTACLKTIGAMNLDPSRYYWSGFTPPPPGVACGASGDYSCTATRFDKDTQPGTEICDCVTAVNDPATGTSNGCSSERTINLNPPLILTPTGRGITIGADFFRAGVLGVIRRNGPPDFWTVDHEKRILHPLSGE